MFDFRSFRFSQTTLNSYAFCPRQFQLRYITQLHWPAEKNSPQLTIERLAREGTLFHRLAEQYFLGISPELIEHQIDPLIDTSVYRYWKNFLIFAKSKFESGNFNQQFKPEHSIFFRLAGFNLQSKVDLLHFNAMNKSIEIFDWKTTRIHPENDTLQTKIYLLALAEHTNQINYSEQDSFSIEYWFAESPKEIIKITKTREELKGWQAQITDQIKQITMDPNFFPVDDVSKCGRCPFRTYCQTGLQAATFNPDDDFENEIDGWFDNPEFSITSE